MVVAPVVATSLLTTASRPTHRLYARGKRSRGPRWGSSTSSRSAPRGARRRPSPTKAWPPVPEAAAPAAAPGHHRQGADHPDRRRRRRRGRLGGEVASIGAGAAYEYRYRAIRLSLDEGEHEASATCFKTDTEAELDFDASFSLSRSWERGQHIGSETMHVLAWLGPHHTSGGADEKGYKFSWGALREQVMDTVTGAGWTYKPRSLMDGRPPASRARWARRSAPPSSAVATTCAGSPRGAARPPRAGRRRPGWPGPRRWQTRSTARTSCCRSARRLPPRTSPTRSPPRGSTACTSTRTRSRPRRWPGSPSARSGAGRRLDHRRAARGRPARRAST